MMRGDRQHLVRPGAGGDNQMPPEENGATSQAETADEPQAGQTSQQSEDQASNARGVDELPDWAQAIVREARKQAAAERKKLQPLEQRLSEFENKDRSDTERLTAERDALAKTLEARETRLRDVTARQTVVEAATKAGSLSPTAVFALVRGDLEYDDDGEPTNVDAVIAAAKADEPRLFPGAPGKADAGAGSTKTEREIQPGMDRLTNAYANLERNRRRG